MSIPAEDFTPKELIGKRVAFKDGADHASCWHFQVGVKTGVVLKIGQTLAEKAALMGPEFSVPEDLLEDEEPPRLWVKVDPTEALPRGCETAVEIRCLQVLEK
ncbi:MAG TPA: hypothetical protein VGY66_30535 [Gemmataceae bacterium]|jgi:hypothetical protein|nr:hypothetical protein [Gemmataceae bacterium]